ncbi:hypothetical protein Tco_0820763 [Tanacetum coccineum]|uniref:Uncharacterized protein n=1 Tax=Tanacetum coccineum TaxID=301880 RepID=A0ABQ5AEM6_9ASTR
MSLHGYTHDEYENYVHSDVDNVTLLSTLDLSQPLHLYLNDFAALTVIRSYIDEVLDRQWDQSNAIILGWILNSISEELYLCQIFSKRASHVWEELKETYDKVDGFNDESHKIVISGSNFGTSQRSQKSAFSANVPRPPTVTGPNDIWNRRTVGGPVLNDGKHSQGQITTASAGERSTNLEDVQNNENFKGIESLTQPQEDAHQNIADTQPVKRSSRPSEFPRNFNDFIVDSKIKYGLEKFVHYTNFKNDICEASY